MAPLRTDKGIRILSLAVLCGLFVSAGAGLVRAAAIADQADVSASPNPVGSGARAAGMGGAFIAIADDATAASWNPGGLVQLERPEVSAVYSYVHSDEEFDSRSQPRAGNKASVDLSSLNYLSAAYPFRLLDRNWVASLNYQRLYEFERDLDFGIDFSGRVAGQRWTIADDVEFEQTGQLYTISPAVAVQLNPRLSLGVTLNLWTDQAEGLFGRNGWKSKQSEVVVTRVGGQREQLTRQLDREYGNAHGLNMHLGLLWDAYQKGELKMTIGAVVKTPFTLDLERDLHLHERNIRLPAGTPIGEGFVDEEDDVRLHFPLRVGAGLACRFSDRFTLSADVTRTEWDDFIMKDDDQSVSFITGRPRGETHVDPTYTVRLGGEYLFFTESSVIALRAGLFSDPEPSEGSSKAVYGAALGAGIKIGDLLFDLAYQYRWGHNVRDEVIQYEGTDADLREHHVFMSAIYHF